MPTLVGISGARRNACVAVAVNGQVRAACEQERLDRVRAVGLRSGRLPTEALNQVLTLAERSQDQVAGYVIAEADVQLPANLPTVSVDHHQAHAATSFLTSTFERAAVLVCDSHAGCELSVWDATGTALNQLWSASRGLATLFSECAELFQVGRGQEHRLEALAHLGRGERVEELRNVFRYVDGTLQVEEGWRTHIHQLIQRGTRTERRAIEAASAVQRRLGELLLELVADIRRRSAHDTLCLGGGNAVALSVERI